MSFFDCVKDAMDEGSIDKDRGARAQKLWKDRSDLYERQGHSRQTAEALAAEDVKASFRKEAGEVRHTYLARLSALRRIEHQVDSAKDLGRIQTSKIEYNERSADAPASLEGKARGLRRYFNWRLSSFLKEHHRDILGRVKNPAGLKDIVRELHGEASGNPTAKVTAQAVKAALEDLRLMFNEAGGLIGKLDDWGLPHAHNRRAVTKAGFDRWYAEINESINWERMTDHLTGKPFQEAGGPPPSEAIKRTVLKSVYDNIAFGKQSREAVYGRPQGAAMYRQMSEHRVLHFRSADDWITYNRKFGTGDPFKSLMSHVHKMTRDIAVMQEFGPSPHLGQDYMRQYAETRARNLGDEALADKVRSDATRAQKMLAVMMGHGEANTALQHSIATFFSSTRHVITSAFLDRAIVSSMSDLNTMRLAAQSMQMNPANVVARHVKLMADSMSREEAMRAGWIWDTISDAGTAMARLQHEIAPAELAERLSSASMRAQWLAFWTDTARVAFQMEMAGYIAWFSGRALKDVDEPLRSLLMRRGITEKQWAAFTNPEHMFKAGNGATFASPMWWLESTDLPKAEAWDIFEKVQSLIEEQTEFAVPTQSLYARSFLETSAPPGSVPYEIAKSALMFKSFTATFTVNQWRRMMAQQTMQGRVMYGLNLAAGATVMGAMALQVGDIMLGRDPQDMTNPMFWARASTKGGGFGIMGDIISTGQSSWGGGFMSWAGGPIPQAAQDMWDLTFKNGAAVLAGEDANFAKDLARMGKRYLPLGQTPAVGPAIDRLLWDQMQLFLDPDSVDAMAKASQKRQNLTGAGEFWIPGEAAPSRLPNLGTAFGQ